MIVRETEPAFFGRVSSLSTLAFAGFGLMGLLVCVLALALSARLRGAGAT